MTSTLPIRPRDVHPRLSGEIATPKGCDGIALQFVERNFHRLAHIGAEQRERIGERAAMLQMRERNKVLRMVLRDNAEAAIAQRMPGERLRDASAVECDPTTVARFVSITVISDSGGVRFRVRCAR